MKVDEQIPEDVLNFILKLRNMMATSIYESLAVSSALETIDDPDDEKYHQQYEDRAKEIVVAIFKDVSASFETEWLQTMAEKDAFCKRLLRSAHQKCIDIIDGRLK